VSIIAIIIGIVVKEENMWYGLFLLIAIPLIVWIEFNARRRREDTRQKAYEKVIELHQQGIQAEVCSRCEGKGRVGIITHDCDKCGGIGYLYDLSGKGLGGTESHQEKQG
jgi:RecJ-like exonuclease